jgi:MFS family permease
MPLRGEYLWTGTRRLNIFAMGQREARGRGAYWRRLLALELSAFGFFGLFWGCFAVLLTDLSGALGLSPGPLGIALFVGAGASIASMAAFGWSSDRLGRRAFLTLTALAFSVAGEMVPDRAGSAISVVTTFGYGGFLLGPPLVGGLAEVAGLRIALGIIAMAGLAVFVLSLGLREPRPNVASE